ncbi:MAG: hypothetical protein ACHQE5_11420, partial [Actinomycetes bacterium]
APARRIGARRRQAAVSSGRRTAVLPRAPAQAVSLVRRLLSTPAYGCFSPREESMSVSSPRLARLALVTMLLAAPAAAVAYGVWVHAVVPVEVLSRLDPKLVPPVRTTMLKSGATDADVAAFRLWFYNRAVAIKDSGVHNAFLKRYPNAAAFDAKAFKAFQMMNPEAQVLGVDPFAAVYRARGRNDIALDPTTPYQPGQKVSIATALEMGSVYPDIDRRNQDRIFRTPDGRVVLTARGDTVPMDPMTLNWGRLTGLSSQAHAHIGLNHEHHSSDPGVLSMTPWNFVIAIGFPTDSVESYAEANAQLYTDLSYIAKLSGGPGTDLLSVFYAGNAMHYIADVGNAIHTLQAGVERFYTDATMQYWMSRLKTVFGLFGATPSRNSIGLDILTNHHTLSEKLFQVELQQAWRLDSLGKRDSISASMRTVLDAMRNGDPLFKRVLESAVLSNAHKYWYPPFGSLIASTVIDSSFQDGATIYRLTREIAVPRLHKLGVAINFDTVADARVWDYVRDRSDPQVKATLDTFNIYQGIAMARVHDALTSWWDRYLITDRTTATKDRPALIDGLMKRVLRDQLNYLNAADARRQEYIDAHGGLKK